MPASGDDYILGRNVAASGRLNLQHFLFQKIIGYKLHPKIKLHETARIADVGTGSGLWMFDIGDDLPSTITLDGFDIDLSQAPPRQWLPGNVRLHEWDIFSSVPPEFEDAFDVVHIRLMVFVVKGGDPSSVVANLFKMLKPGGWLQWSDVDFLTYKNFEGPDGGNTAVFQQLRDAITPADTRLATQNWVADLGTYLQRSGMAHVECDRTTVDDQRGALSKYALFRIQNAFQVHTELIDAVPPEKREGYIELIRQGGHEVMKGTGAMADHVVWIAQKS